MPFFYAAPEEAGRRRAGKRARPGGQDGSHKRFLKGSVVCVREDGGIGVL